MELQLQLTGNGREKDKRTKYSRQQIQKLNQLMLKHSHEQMKVISAKAALSFSFFSLPGDKMAQEKITFSICLMSYRRTHSLFNCTIGSEQFVLVI